MSSDDAIAVVYNKGDGKWYVACIGGDNISRVVSHGEAFSSKKDAKIHAKKLHRRWGTEYGVCVYGDN